MSKNYLIINGSCKGSINLNRDSICNGQEIPRRVIRLFAPEDKPVFCEYPSPIVDLQRGPVFYERHGFNAGNNYWFIYAQEGTEPGEIFEILINNSKERYKKEKEK